MSEEVKDTSVVEEVPEPAKEEAKKAETKKEEKKPAETKKEAPAKDESKKEEAKKAEPAKEVKKEEYKQAKKESIKIEPVKKGTGIYPILVNAKNPIIVFMRPGCKSGLVTRVGKLEIMSRSEHGYAQVRYKVNDNDYRFGYIRNAEEVIRRWTNS